MNSKLIIIITALAALIAVVAGTLYFYTKAPQQYTSTTEGNSTILEDINSVPNDASLDGSVDSLNQSVEGW